MDKDKSEFEALYERAFRASEAVIAAGQEHAPLILILTKDDELNMMKVSHFDKDTIAIVFKNAASNPNVKCAMLITEAWTLKPDITDLDKLRRHGKISDHPQREEVVMFNILAGDRQAILACPIDRSNNSLKMVKFEWLDEQFLSSIGRFTKH